MEFSVKILGCGSAKPSLRHLLSSQVVEHYGKLFMIDCGEGAQLQMMRMRLKQGKLNNIFLSHLHGDHFLGLPGLISTMALHEKGSALTIHTFAEGAEMLQSMMKFLLNDAPFDLKFNIIDPTKHQLLFEDKTLSISSFPLYHRVPCVGFLFREKSIGRRINGEMAKFHCVPHYFMESLRRGDDYVKADGTVIPNAHLTLDPPEPASYAYCTDTAFDRRLVTSVRGVHTLYCDCTYGDDNAPLAAPRGHSTARQDGELARRAGASKLILGHYSSRYDAEGEKELAAQASEEFSGSIILANEGMTIPII